MADHGESAVVAKLSCNQDFLGHEEVDAFYGVNFLCYGRASESPEYAVVKIFVKRVFVRAA